jgi:hypothetical protein
MERIRLASLHNKVFSDKRPVYQQLGFTQQNLAAVAMTKQEAEGQRVHLGVVMVDKGSEWSTCLKKISGREGLNTHVTKKFFFFLRVSRHSLLVNLCRSRTVQFLLVLCIPLSAIGIGFNKYLSLAGFHRYKG